MHPATDLVVFSHLRWSFVWQRPQHLLTRLAMRRRVIVIEEPVLGGAGEPSWEIETPSSNVTVCRLRSPLPTHGFSDDQLQLMRENLPELLARLKVSEAISWFYTPMALPLLDAVPTVRTVYDCMDELSAFKGAPAQMLSREAELLQTADLVFTGGPSLYKAKKDRHPHVYCFPSSVAADHFGKAAKGIEESTLQAPLTHPRLGYFGVIDERFDAELIRFLAAERPQWQFCLVGPVVKIDPATLPQAQNIHYFGQQPYEQLPAFLAGWDVCLLPFARNESTRFISPTKTLEYMAAEKPIVSTPITDVAEPYGDIVYIGDEPASFLAGCERALQAPAREYESRVSRMREVLAKTSWDQTVQQMERLLVEPILEERGEPRPSLSSMAAGTRTEVVSRPVIVIGAGPTGLSAAYHLGREALILERNDRVGGWCRSIEVNGFTFDFAGHIMFSNDSYVHELYRKLLGDNVHWQEREAWIYSKNVYSRYPFQGSLYGLPPQVIKDCILGAIEARFPSAKPVAEQVLPNVNGSLNGHSKCASANGRNGHAAHEGNGGVHPKVEDCCADGVMESTAKLVHPQRDESAAPNALPKSENFEEFIYRVWGRGIAQHFAIPYNRKLWAVPLTEMETSWLGGRVPMPNLEEMIDGALSPTPKPMGPNARFGYPLRGGFQSLMDGFLPHIKESLRLDTAVMAVSPRRRTVTLNDGTELPYEQLISTMPLPVLIRQLGDEAPSEIRDAASRLRYVSVRCVHLGIGRENLTEKHWIYYPEETIFHRIFVQGNASPHCNPPGGFGLTCEITYHPQYKPLPVEGDELIERCIRDCHQVGIFKADDEVWAKAQVDLPHAYVVYDHERLKHVALIREWLAEQDILLAGRYSEWEYYNSDHAFLAGKKAADQAQRRRATSDATPRQAAMLGSS